MIETHLDLLKQWVRDDLGSHANPDALLRSFACEGDSQNGTTKGQLFLWTKKNVYRITVEGAVPRGDPTMVVDATNRAMRVGEFGHLWRLVCGPEPFSARVWERSLHTILSYELEAPREKERMVPYMEPTAELLPLPLHEALRKLQAGRDDRERLILERWANIIEKGLVDDVALKVGVAKTEITTGEVGRERR